MLDLCARIGCQMNRIEFVIAAASQLYARDLCFHERIKLVKAVGILDYFVLVGFMQSRQECR